jgi:hypothetical protein
MNLMSLMTDKKAQAQVVELFANLQYLKEMLERQKQIEEQLTRIEVSVNQIMLEKHAGDL